MENLPTVKKIVSGENHILALTVRGEVFSWGSGENGQLGRVGARFADRSCLRKACQREALLTPKSLKLVTKLAKATNIFTGMNHSFALTDKHGLVGWGLNNCGQLGTRHVHSKGVLCCFSPVVIDYFHGHDIIEVAGGDHHTLVLVHPTTVYSCGDGQYGRLGIGRGIVHVYTHWKKLKETSYRCERERERGRCWYHMCEKYMMILHWKHGLKERERER